MTRGFPQWRIRCVAALVFITASVLVYRIVQVQIVRHDSYRNAAKKQWHKKMTWPARRGGIFDRGGLPLAVTHRNYSVGITPAHFPADQKSMKSFAQLLGLSLGKLKRAVLKRSAYVPLGRDLVLTEKEVAAVSSFRGARLDQSHDRLHPFEAVPLALIGAVDDGGSGAGGIEDAFEEVLGGRDGWFLVNRDALDSTFHLVNAPGRKPAHGHDLYLTIDSRIQSIVDFELDDAVERYGAARGTAMVLCPKTGDILALAERSARAPSLEGDAPRDAVLHSTCSIFEPGSTFKLVTHSYLLERGIVDPYDAFYTEGGRVSFDFGTFEDDHKVDTWYSFKETFVHSSNVCTIKAVKNCDPDDFYRYILLFGFGGRTGIPLPSESRGILHKPGDAEWSKRSLASIAIGHEIGVTPLQMAMAYCALANGGELVVPRIALAVKDAKGRVVERYPVIRVRRVFSPETAETMKEFCAGVVENGTGKKAAVKGLRVGGKTGTAQKPGEGGYQRGKYVTSFIGFAPLDAPTIVCLVLLDEPRYPYYWGGESAAVVFSRIIEGIHLTTDLLQAAEEHRVAIRYRTDETVKVPSFLRLTYDEALDLASTHGLRITCSHSRGWVYSQIPDPGSVVEPGGEVRLLFCGDDEELSVRVPDCEGLSVREARRLLIECGLRGSVTGFGFVREQVPAPGTSAAKKGKVRLICSPPASNGKAAAAAIGTGGTS